MKLCNGAHVLRANINYEDPDVAVGVVLARWYTDFVTWAVYKRPGDMDWEAEHGHYFHFDVNSSESIANAERDAKDDFASRTGARVATRP